MSIGQIGPEDRLHAIVAESNSSKRTRAIIVSVLWKGRWFYCNGKLYTSRPWSDNIANKLTKSDTFHRDTEYEATALLLATPLRWREPERAFSGILGNIVHRDAKAESRATMNGRLLTTGMAGELEFALPKAPSPHGAYVAREALATLDPLEREILHRSFLLGESHKRIGADLGLTATAVTQRLHRAKKKLRQQMKDVKPTW